MKLKKEFKINITQNKIISIKIMKIKIDIRNKCYFLLVQGQIKRNSLDKKNQNNEDQN